MFSKRAPSDWSAGALCQRRLAAGGACHTGLRFAGGLIADHPTRKHLLTRWAGNTCHLMPYQSLSYTSRCKQSNGNTKPPGTYKQLFIEPLFGKLFHHRVQTRGNPWADCRRSKQQVPANSCLRSGLLYWHPSQPMPKARAKTGNLFGSTQQHCQTTRRIQ